MQRRAYGEQVVRTGCVLAALTGNVGVPGGWASGMGFQAPDGGPLWNVFPLADPAIAGPALVVKPHRHAAIAAARTPEVANWEEV